MRQSKVIYLSLALAINTLGGMNAHALDPITTGTVGAGLNLIQGSIFSNIDDSVDNFFDNVDDSAANLRTLADGLLASARSDFNGILDKSIEDLNTQERQMWNYYYGMMNDLDRRVAGYLKDGRYTMLHAGNVVNEVVPFKSKKPQVFWIEAEPPFYDYDAPTRTITAYGLNLGHSKNKLLSGKTEGDRTTLSPTKLSFQFKSINVENGMKVDYELWEDRFFRDRIKPTPEIQLPRVQDQLGEMALIYSSKDYEIIERKYPPSGGRYSKQCRNSRYDPTDRCTESSGTRTITATDGYSILPDTIKIEKDSPSSCEYNQVTTTNETANSFNWKQRIKADDGLGRRCKAHLKLTWQETKDNGTNVRNVSDYKPFKRSLHGVSFEYPLNNAQPIGMSFKPNGEDTAQNLSLSSIRWPIETRTEQDTGIIEVQWLK